MKKLLFMAIALGALVACQGRNTSVNEKWAAELGRKAAHEVINTKANSMEQEHLLLTIRATEEKFKHAGDTVAAWAYIHGAEEVLDSAGILNIRREIPELDFDTLEFED